MTTEELKESARNRAFELAMDMLVKQVMEEDRTVLGAFLHDLEALAIDRQLRLDLSRLRNELGEVAADEWEMSFKHTLAQFGEPAARALGLHCRILD